MAAINHHKAYCLSLSGGLAWEIGPCKGADPGVEAWVGEFASHLGLEPAAGGVSRNIRFGRVRDENGYTFDCYSCFVPRLSAEYPSEGWQAWGRAGAVLLRHPEIEDVFCGLFHSRHPVIEPMRHALVPILEEAIASGGLPIHGALVEYQGMGVILMGRSGVGKTTCCRRLPSYWQVLGDDLALAVQSEGGSYRAHPLPTWSAVGSGEVRWPCRANRSVVMQALILLEQSVRDRIEELSQSKAAVAITEACTQALKPLYMISSRDGASLRSRIFENAVALARTVPAFRLQVSLTGRFWEKIEELLGKMAS
jgi:SynChlorMet cassette protein ScmC